MDSGGAQEHYWTDSVQGRKTEAVYRPYSDGIDGEQIFMSLIFLCVMYFITRLFFNGLILVLIVGLTVTLIMQLLEGVSSSFMPKYPRRF